MIINFYFIDKFIMRVIFYSVTRNIIITLKCLISPYQLRTMLDFFLPSIRSIENYLPNKESENCRHPSHHTFWGIFLPSLHGKFQISWRTEINNHKFFFLFLNMQMVLTNSTPGDLSMFDEVRVLE